MKIYCENDVIRLQELVLADVVGEGRALTMPVGAIGTVVLVHGDPMKPAAYEVEFYIQVQNCYALATIEAVKIA